MNRKGFTLVELLAVIVIMAILIGIASPAVTSLSNSAKMKTLCQKVNDLESAATLYAQEKYATDEGEFEYADSSESESNHAYVQAIELVQMGYIKDDNCEITYEAASGSTAAHYTYSNIGDGICLEDSYGIKESLANEYINIYKYGDTYVAKFDYSDEYKVVASSCDDTVHYYVDGGAYTAPVTGSYTFSKEDSTCNNVTIGSYDLTTGTLKDTNNKVIDVAANNCTLFFYSTEKNYTIHYDANGGTGAPSDQTRTYGTKGEKLSSTIPTRDNYTFLGWTTSTKAAERLEVTYEAGQTIRQELIPFNDTTGLVTLYAVWQQDVRRITYNANGGTCSAIATDLTNVDRKQETKIPTNVTCTKANMQFLGWSTDPNATTALFKGGDVIRKAGESISDMTLYAIYKSASGVLTCAWTDQNGNPQNYTVTMEYANAIYPTSCSTMPQINGTSASGWSYTENGTILSNSTVIKSANLDVDSLTLYAVWSGGAKYLIDLNGYYGGSTHGNISGYGTVDIYINGSLYKSNQSDFYETFASGTTYEITNLKLTNGHKYLGTYQGSLKGTITNSNIGIYLNFN